MQTLHVPVGLDNADYHTAHRRKVGVVSVFGGLAVTVSVDEANRFSVTHVRTGCGFPGLHGLRLLDAEAIAVVLAECFPWGDVDDPFFIHSMPSAHRDALLDCLRSIQEMFEVE